MEPLFLVTAALGRAGILVLHNICSLSKYVANDTHTHTHTHRQLLFVVMTMLCLTGCRPDAITDIASDHKSQDTGITDVHRDFIARYTAGALKSRSPYHTVSEALEMMNEGLNSLYCRPGQKFYNRTLTFFDTLSVSVNGSGEIHEDDVADAMDAFAKFAGEIYYDREEEDTSKVSWAFHVRAIGMTMGAVNLSAMYVMQVGEPLDESDAFPYQQSWPWYYNEGTQQTAACASPNTSTGAEDLFRRDLRKTLNYMWNKTDPPFYYLNLQVVYYVWYSGFELPFVSPDLIYDGYELGDLINPEDEEEEDNYYDYFIWSNNSDWNNYHLCLTTGEMNFHYGGLRDLLLNRQPTGTNTIANVEVGYGTYDYGAYVENVHLAQGWYANRILVAMGYEEPIQLPEP